MFGVRSLYNLWFGTAPAARMARFSLWTPLIVILTIQLILLVYLNLKTSAPTNTELLSVRISSSDAALGLRNTRGSLVNIQSVVQIGAPANDLNGEQRNGEKETVLNKNVPQIDAPGEDVDNVAEQRVQANDGADALNLVVKKEREREPSDKERGVGVGDSEKGDAAIKRREQKGVVSVNRNELRKRSDDEQLVGEREKANALGDRKGQLLQQREVHGVSTSKKVQDGSNLKKEEAVKDRDKRQTVDKKADYGLQKVPNTGRRKMNQVSMLKARDPDRPVLAGDQNDNNKKLSASEEKKEFIAMKKDDIKKSIQSNPSVNGKMKVAEKNVTNKRPLIEKISQLKMMKKAGYGRLKDMPFMKARRFVQQEEEEMKQGMKPPKFNQKQIDDLLKYSDKLNYFEEFCKEVAEPLVECGERKARKLTEAEKAGQNIMFTLRTTLDYHDQRLPVLFETWLSTVDPRTVFLVTDGEDTELDDNTENIGEGMYVMVKNTTSPLPYIVL